LPSLRLILILCKTRVPEMDFGLTLAGAVTGLLVGLTGVGGGALMTPMLLLIFGINPLVAVGTDLWFAAITKLSASKLHNHEGLIDWVVVKRLWLGSLSAAGVTLLWMRWHPVNLDSISLMQLIIASVVILTAIGMLLQKILHSLGRNFRTSQVEQFKMLQLPLTIMAGALIGILVTLTSIGAGALGAVFLTYLYPLRLTPPRLIATDIVHAIPLAMFAGLGHLIIGNVNFSLLGNLLIGSIPSALLGAVLSAKLPHGLLRITLAIVLFAIGVKLFAS